ncbi:MAG: ABC transporter permease [Verrucomicrobiota bacterium]
MASLSASTPRQSWLGDFGRELRSAVRALRRAPAFSVVVVVSLGCGLALATITLAIANAYLLRAFPYADGDRLFHVRYAPPGPYEPRGMSRIDWTALGDVIDANVTSAGDAFFLGEMSAARLVRATRASPGFMAGLGVRPILGQVFAEADYQPGGPEVALIGHAVWQSRFNSDPAIVGREFQATPENQAGGAVMVRVVGVLPPGFWFGRNSSSPIEMLLPLRVPVRTYMVRLREGVPVAYAEQRLTAAARQVGSDFRPGWKGVQLDGVRDRYVAEMRPLLFGMNAATGLVFALVCTNVAILFLLRTLRRQREIAVRLALGAGMAHVLRMLLAEAVLLGGASLALGVALTVGALRGLGPVIEARLGKPPPGGSAALNVDLNVVLMIGGVGVLVVLALALLPLLAPRRWQLADVLRRAGLGATDGPAMRRLRTGLIAFEVAGAFVLLVGGGLMLRSVWNLVSTDLGFEAEKVVRASVHLPSTYREPAAQAQFFQRLAERLAADTPAASVGSSFPPYYESHKRTFEADAAAEMPHEMGGLIVGAGYFATHGIALRQGREFTLGDRLDAEPVAIVSESLARQLWPEGGALGRRVRGVQVSEPDAPLGPWRTVVGVVRDVRQTYGDSDLRDVYYPFLQAPTRFGNVQLRIDRPGAVSPTRLAEVVAALEPRVRVGEPTLIADEDQQFARARFMLALIGGFGGFATLLALLGIYGVTAYAVQQREREVAIRIAVGATESAIVRLFLREGGLVIGAGVGLGIGGALAAGRVLESQVHGVRTLDVATLAVVGGFLALCGAGAIWWPVRRAATGNIQAVLKAE